MVVVVWTVTHFHVPKLHRLKGLGERSEGEVLVVDAITL